ncbi:MAG TPA: GDSL-type esterase/lipase family protein [Solirubrobacteraceae bacterium]|nr:GDSL-type esterase/lipase family protein [Solirubrobacteraceae bacterium]
MSGRQDGRYGVLAFGDSITHAGGDVQWGVALHSWALWVARGLGLPYSGYAMDGALVTTVTRFQIPSFRKLAVHAEAGFELGLLYVGTNDVRQPGWQAAAFAEEFAAGLGFLAERCDRVLTLTIPLDMGRPRAVAQVEEANGVIESVARSSGALVCDLRQFGGRTVMMADHVHPTAFGQIAIAEAALDVLAGDGVEVRARPWSMIHYSVSRRERMHFDVVYAYRGIKTSLRAFVMR